MLIKKQIIPIYFHADMAALIYAPSPPPATFQMNYAAARKNSIGIQVNEDFIHICHNIPKKRATENNTYLFVAKTDYQPVVAKLLSKAEGIWRFKQGDGIITFTDKEIVRVYAITNTVNTYTFLDAMDRLANK